MCEEDYDEDTCDHEDYDIDIVTGEWSCWHCGEHRSATSSEIDMMIQHTADYAEYEERENRRQWWSDVIYNIRHPLQAIHWQLQKRGWLQPRAVNDDEIPF